MVFETAFSVLGELLKLDPFMLFALVLAGAYVSLRVLGMVIRILLTGLAFGSFPVIANLAGIGVPLTIQSIMWSALLGIMIYFVFMGLKFGYTIMNAALWPFTRKRGKKVVVKKVPKEEKD